MDWARLTCVTPPARQVATEIAKAHLNVDHADDDDLIDGIVDAAQASIVGPNGIGIALAASTWRLSLDEFPGGLASGTSIGQYPGRWLDASRRHQHPVIAIELGPVKSITSITYIDAAGGLQTLASSEYLVDLDRRPARIVPSYGKSWPPTRCQPGAVKITFVAGETAAPKDLQQAILLMLGHWYANREAVIADARVAVATLPLAVDSILDRYRAPSL